MPDIAKQNASNPDVVVYMPPNKLKNKVTLNGKIKGNGYDPKVLARANARVRAMGNDLLQAVATEMKRLEEICSELDDDPDAENFETLEKIAHEITGYGTTVGFDLLIRFGRSLSLFLRKTEIKGAVKARVACVHVDSMNLVYRTLIKGTGDKQGDTLTAMLNLTIAKFVANP